MPYEYHAQLVKVTDGDTVVLDVDLGFRVTHRSSFRVYFVQVVAGGLSGEGTAERVWFWGYSASMLPR